MNKQTKLYEIRKQNEGSSTSSISPRLRNYNRARKLASYLRRRYGINTYLAGWKVAA